jgi:hypothetical protein
MVKQKKEMVQDMVNKEKKGAFKQYFLKKYININNKYLSIKMDIVKRYEYDLKKGELRSCSSPLRLCFR